MHSWSSESRWLERTYNLVGNTRPLLVLTTDLLQIPPLLVMCIMLVVYGFIQPYKSRTANIMEIVVQTNFIILLSLESTSFLKDAYNVFPPPQLQATTTLNETAVACKDDLPGVSLLTKILLPFFYTPLLLFFVTATTELILYNRWAQLMSSLRYIWSSWLMITDSFCSHAPYNLVYQCHV